MNPDIFNSVWSATPTPFNDRMQADVDDVNRLVEHHIAQSCGGLFIAGTCGEGPWMTDGERRRLVRGSVAASNKRLPIAVQVSDNSAARILVNAEMAAEEKADFVVIAPPRFLLNATSRALAKLYREAIENAPLPVVIYDLGAHAQIEVPVEVLRDIYAMPQVVACKDSSGDAGRRDIALQARAARPDLRLLNGDEFHCDEYIAAGYDGLMIGGGAVIGKIANQILEAAKAGDANRARELQERMTQLFYVIYGGPTISTWLAGLKQTLVAQGVFSTTHNFLDYQVSDDDKQQIAAMLRDNKDVF